MAASAFLDKYFECVDCLPLDLQRYVSRLREIELEKRELFMETRRLKADLMKAVESGSKKQMILFRQLQECLLQVREVGNTKLEISARMLDTVEEYTQQLALCSKELEMNPHSDDLLLTPRAGGGTSHCHTHPVGESPANNGISDSKSSIKRCSSLKRPRQPATMTTIEKDEDASVSFIANSGGGGGGGGAKDGGSSGGKVKEGISVGVVCGGGLGGSGGAGGNGGNGKPPKKKVKTVKKRITTSKDKDSSPPPTAHVPMPDLTSQPLDPNEPTYCLCQQVSFGEMIGCDNYDCQIEWFHFQCVGLTSKPKGKWYCPTCTQERRSKSNK